MSELFERALLEALKQKYEPKWRFNDDDSVDYHRRELERLESGVGVGDGAIYDAMYHEGRIRELTRRR